MGDISEQEFNEIVDDYEHRVSQPSETFSGLLGEYSKVTGRAINSDNVNVEDAGASSNNDGLYRQAQREAARLGTFVASDKSYLRASEIDSENSPICNLIKAYKNNKILTIIENHFDTSNHLICPQK